MKEIRMDEETLNLETLIQVTLIPKGEQRLPKAALKRIMLKLIKIAIYCFSMLVQTKFHKNASVCSTQRQL